LALSVGLPTINTRLAGNPDTPSRDQKLVHLLFPRTDAGVLIEVAVVVGFLGIMLAVFWRHSEGRLLVLGVGLLLLGLMALRAVH